MYIDLFLVGFAIYGFVMGFNRGIIRAIVSIVAFVLGILAALKLSPFVIAFFQSVLNLDKTLSLILGLLLTFFLIMWGIRLLGKGLEAGLKKIKLNFINKLLGGVLLSGLMIVVYSFIIWFLAQTSVIGETQKTESKSYPYLQEVPSKSREALEHMKPVFREFWDKMEHVISGDKDVRE